RARSDCSKTCKLHGAGIKEQPIDAAYIIEAKRTAAQVDVARAIDSEGVGDVDRTGVLNRHRARARNTDGGIVADRERAAADRVHAVSGGLIAELQVVTGALDRVCAAGLIE